MKSTTYSINSHEKISGGEEEDRTPDLCIANAALSQLSYPPKVLMSLATFSNLAKDVSSAAGATRGQLCEPDSVKFRMP